MNDQQPDCQHQDPEPIGGQGEALDQAVVAARFVASEQEEAADDQGAEHAGDDHDHDSHQLPRDRADRQPTDQVCIRALRV